MINPEVLPIAGGAVLGGIASYAYHRTQRWSYVAAILLLALCATLASGEFRQSWGFLLEDALIVTLSTGGAYLVCSLFLNRYLLRKG